MEKIGSLLKKPAQGPLKSRGPRNERDEYLEYFFGRLKGPYEAHTGKPLTMRYLAMRIAHLKTIQDLHYMKHICEDAEGRGKPFSMVFWGSIKPRD